MFRFIRQFITIRKLQEENKRLKEELAQKDTIIQYLNGCVNKANKRSLGYLCKILAVKSCENLDFPNSSVEEDRQMSISDILED